MCVLDGTVAIKNGHQRHPPKFEQVDLLAVQQSDSMLRIWQSDKWQSLCPPVQTKDLRPIRSNRKYLHIPPHKRLIVVSQARQLRAAVWSKESAEKRQHDWPAPVV